MASRGGVMGELRVMTWNGQNLFEPGGDSGPRTAAQLAAKVASLAAVIDDVEPHVLALQEVGSSGALGALFAVLAAPMHTGCARARPEPEIRPW